MDKQRLKQYRALQREISQLERQIDKLRRARIQPGTMVRDTVQASSRDHPYTQYRKSIIGWIAGDDPIDREREIKALEADLKECKRCCQIEMWRIRRYINTRPCSEDRQLLRMYFLDGLSLKEIGEEMCLDLSVVGKRLKKMT